MCKSKHGDLTASLRWFKSFTDLRIQMCFLIVCNCKGLSVFFDCLVQFPVFYGFLLFDYRFHLLFISFICFIYVLKLCGPFSWIVCLFRVDQECRSALFRPRRPFLKCLLVLHWWRTLFLRNIPFPVSGRKYFLMTPYPVLLPCLHCLCSDFRLRLGAQ